MIIELYEIIDQDQVLHIGYFEVSSYEEADKFIDQLSSYAKAIRNTGLSGFTSNRFYYEEVNYPKLPTPTVELSVLGRTNSSKIKLEMAVNFGTHPIKYTNNESGFYKISVKIEDPQNEDHVAAKLHELETFAKNQLSLIMDNESLTNETIANLELEISKKLKED